MADTARATLKDVAEHAGLAINTVRKALRDDPSVRPYLRERVLASAAKLRYRPNLFGRALRTNELELVPISLPLLSDPYFGALATNLAECLNAQSYESALCVVQSHLVDLAQAWGACASIIGYTADAPTVATLCRSQKVVTINGQSRLPRNAADVRIDFTPAYETIVSRLVSEGRSRIALCSGYYLQCLEMGRPAQKFDVVERVVRRPGLSLVRPGRKPAFASPEQLAQRWDRCRGKIDAILCENDVTASLVVAQLAQRGVSSPADVRVVGCNGIDRPAGAWTVEVDTEAIAAEAVGLMGALLNGERTPGETVYTPRAVTDDHPDTGRP